MDVQETLEYQVHASDPTAQGFTTFESFVIEAR